MCLQSSVRICNDEKGNIQPPNPSFRYPSPPPLVLPAFAVAPTASQGRTRHLAAHQPLRVGCRVVAEGALKEAHPLWQADLAPLGGRLYAVLLLFLKGQRGRDRVVRAVGTTERGRG